MYNHHEVEGSGVLVDPLSGSLPIFDQDFLTDQGRIREILDVLGPKLGKEPYGVPDFELASPIGEDKRIWLVNEMLSLPDPEGRNLFRRSLNLRQISDDATTHKAIETMYVGPNHDKIVETGDGLLWARLFIENIHNAMAVRNRLRIIKAEFGHFMEPRLTGKPQDTEVLSIAAGSSRAIMEELRVLNGRGHDRIRLKMVDLNREALQDGRKLVTNLGINESVEFVRAHFLSFNRYLKDYKPDFVEIVGLIDYPEAEQSVDLLEEVRNHLPEGGVVLFSSIAPNDEQEFTRHIVGWPKEQQPDMKYRNAVDLLRLATAAGFAPNDLRVIPEPLGIYNLVSATK